MRTFRRCCRRATREICGQIDTRALAAVEFRHGASFFLDADDGRQVKPSRLERQVASYVRELVAGREQPRRNPRLSCTRSVKTFATAHVCCVKREDSRYWR